MKAFLYMLFVGYLLSGCAGSGVQTVIETTDPSLDKKLQAQKEASDREVRKLEEEIAKYEADKAKYGQDAETFNNNPILDILDETLKEQDNKIGEKI